MLQELTYDEKTKEFTKGALREFYDEAIPADSTDWERECLSDIPARLSRYSFIAGHGVINYDLPILAHHLDFHPKAQVIDTLVISRKNFPDRPGGHSVEAWGPRLKMRKKEQEAWEVMNEDIRERGRSDVLLETEIFFAVLREMQSGVKKCQQ
jgi:hypothetical protein